MAERPRQDRTGQASGTRTHGRRNQRQAGVQPVGGDLDLLGLERRLFRFRRGRPRLFRRNALHAGGPGRRPQFTAVVQHRPLLGLWHRRPRPRPFLRRLPDRLLGPVPLRLRAPTASRLLHPGHHRRPGQRRRHHGSLGSRSQAVQVRVRHRHQFLGPEERKRKPFRRRQVVRPDEFPQDRRPRGRRHQVRRHNPPRRQDGCRRYRPSGYRAVHQLESSGRTEGRGPGGRVQAGRQAPERGDTGMQRRRRQGPVRPEQEFEPEKGHPRKPPGDDPGKLRPAGDPFRPPGVHGNRIPGIRHRLGFGSLPHRFRTEFQ